MQGAGRRHSAGSWFVAPSRNGAYLLFLGLLPYQEVDGGQPVSLWRGDRRRMEQQAWVVLEVQDVADSLAFYTEYLGWSPGERLSHNVQPVVDPDGDVLLLAGPGAGDVTRYLKDHALRPRPGGRLRMPHPDVDSLYSQVRERGLQNAQVVETPWRDRELHLQAPDGYTVVFRTPVRLTPDETLALYAAGLDVLDEALSGLAEPDLDLAGTPDGWTIRQIVHHIADGDDLWSMCLKAALAAPGCSYEHDWYSTDNACAKTLDYAGRAIEPAVALFQANRRHVVQLVRHLPDAWDRFVLFKRAAMPEPQSINVGFIVRIQARHALEHVEEIRAIRQALRAIGPADG